MSSYQVVAFYNGSLDALLGPIMSLDFNLMKLIAKGKKENALRDIVYYLNDQKCATIAILDDLITDLQDKAIRNFIAKLHKLDYVEFFSHQLPGGRWVTLIVRKDYSDFNIQAVVKAHLATRKKKPLYRAQEIRFVEDVPFEFYTTGREMHYRNEQLKIHVRMDCDIVSSPVARAEKYVRQQLRTIQRKTPQLLQYFKKGVD